MRSYYIVHVQGRGNSAVLLVNGEIVHRTAPSQFAEMCGESWINGTWDKLRKVA